MEVDGKPETMAQFAARWIRERIISGELESGARISQDGIARELKLSLTPVREAIVQLRVEGYVHSEPHMGAHVRHIDLARIEEAYEARQICEGYLARRAAERLSDAQLRELLALAGSFRELAQHDRAFEARRVNYRLHQLIWNIADAPIMRDFADTLWSKFDADSIWTTADRGVRSADDHRRILSALEAGDPDAAEAAMREHIISGQRDYWALQDGRTRAQSTQ